MSNGVDRVEELILSVAEKSIVGGAFLYMLYFFIGRFSTTQEKISDTLNRVCDVLIGMNLRLEQLEKRISALEGGDKT